jgi:putative transcription factor
MKCELCGEKSATAMVEIEGSMLRACSKCSSFGNIKFKIEAPVSEKAEEKTITIKMPPARKEILQVLVKGYGRIIKGAREKANLTQEELGKKINEKATIIHKIETGHIEPSLEFARKLEKFFRITLIEEYQETSSSEKRYPEKELTLGDLARVRKR